MQRTFRHLARFERNMWRELMESSLRQFTNFDVSQTHALVPRHEVNCEEPLLTIDKQIGVNAVHPDGRPAQTIFRRISYDLQTNTSVVSCEFNG